MISARITSWLEGQQFFLVWRALKGRKRWIQMEKGRPTLERGFSNVGLLCVDLLQQIPANIFIQDAYQMDQEEH